MLDKLEVGLLREPIIGFGTEPSQKASVPVIGKYGLLEFAENSISIKKENVTNYLPIPKITIA
jgi:hypothetical protein